MGTANALIRLHRCACFRADLIQGFSYLSKSGSRGRLLGKTAHKYSKLGKTRLEKLNSPFYFRGWSGGAMVLGKLPLPGRPTNLDESRARA